MTTLLQYEISAVGMSGASKFMLRILVYLYLGKGFGFRANV